MFRWFTIGVHDRNCESTLMKNIKTRRKRISTLQVGKIGPQMWLFYASCQSLKTLITFLFILKYTPQQENGFDCGVFTCQFMETLSRGEEFFNFTQKDMPYFRRRMIWEIGNTKLRDEHWLFGFVSLTLFCILLYNFRSAVDFSTFNLYDSVKYKFPVVGKRYWRGKEI